MSADDGRRYPPAPCSLFPVPSLMRPLRLRRNEDRRLRAGHLWVFSNEVDVAHTPLTSFEPGDPVQIQDSRGAPVGTGYVNPRSLICARLVSRRPDRALDAELLRRRIGSALGLRTRLFAGDPYYRLVYGEGDGLPGLVVDRFGEMLVVQITTAGMERLRAEVVSALVELVGPAGILLRNDTGSRELEGLESYVEVAHGTVPERVEIRENGIRFVVPLTGGQKTGWFYDHRDNRARLRRYVGGRRVLDVFSYAGGWGVQAAAASATEVVCVDSSASALALVGESASLNGVEGRMATLQGDAFDALRDLGAAGERFDVIVLDPPAFIKRRKDQKQGEKAYQKLNRLALEILSDEGVLVSASCSYHLGREALLDAVLRAGQETDRELQILEEGHQGPDHPVHPAIPETAYLKAFFARAMR
ncbi:MAG: class I SAM-dependent rRNA methyltransferase [Gemmatimonadetes bacterium]|nr:class I SAM-dependent rRNA methyltransferase [Gemmatimonadota bacterium]